MNEVIPLVYFTHAELKSKENINANIEYIEDTPASKTLNSNLRKTSKRNKCIKLTIEDDKMKYEAIEENEQPFVIGILDKKNGNISIRNTTYFVMKPECYLSSKQEQNNQMPVNPNLSYSDKLNSLTAAFGSSKKRKAMQTKLKNKLDVETLETAVGNAIEESKKNAVLRPVVSLDKDLETESNFEADFSIMPKQNKEAKAPNEVYQLNEALSIETSEFERFTLELSKKFAIATNESIKIWKASSQYPEYVCEFLSRLTNSKSNQKYKIEKCKQLAYINFLILLYKLKAAQLRTKSPLSAYEVNDSLMTKLFHLYTVNSNDNAQAKSIRSMPRRLKDKLTCHILVLALHLEDFSAGLEVLQKDLKLSMQRLSDFSQALGCHVRSQVVMVDKKKVVCKTANLTLPLFDAGLAQAKKRARKN